MWGNLVETDSYPTGTGSPNVTRYAVDGWNPALAGATGNTRFNVWADLNGSNALVTRYLHGDQPDQLFARQDAGVQYWYLTDYQGSVRDVLDNSGNVKDAITYDGFGNIITETNSAYRGSYAWTGRLLDVETGLEYNRARWYDSSTGRWQSQDPLGFDAGDSNLYRYVNSAPTDQTDPSGMDRYLFESTGASYHSYVIVDNWIQDAKTGLCRKTGAIRVDFSLNWPDPEWFQKTPVITTAFLTKDVLASITVGSSAKITFGSDEDPKNMVAKAVGIVGNATLAGGLPVLAGIEENTILNRSLNKDKLLKSRETSPAEDIGALRDILKRFSKTNWPVLGTTYHALLHNCNDYAKWIFNSETTADLHSKVEALPVGVVKAIGDELGPK